MPLEYGEAKRSMAGGERHRRRKPSGLAGNGRIRKQRRLRFLTLYNRETSAGLRSGISVKRMQSFRKRTPLMPTQDSEFDVFVPSEVHPRVRACTRTRPAFVTPVFVFRARKTLANEQDDR